MMAFAEGRCNRITSSLGAMPTLAWACPLGREEVEDEDEDEKIAWQRHCFKLGRSAVWRRRESRGEWRGARASGVSRWHGDGRLRRPARPFGTGGDGLGRGRGS